MFSFAARKLAKDLRWQRNQFLLAVTFVDTYDW